MRPLIVRFAALGDMVLLTTLIEILHRRFGERVDLLGSGGWTPHLLASDPRVGHVQLLGSRKSAYLTTPAQWRAVKWLRRRPAGPVYLCEPDAKSAWLLKRAGIGDDSVLRAFDFPAGEQLQFSRWWEQIGQLTPRGIAAPPVLDLQQVDCAPRLYISDQDHIDCEQWLRARGWLPAPLVLIQPGNKRTLKRGRMAALTDNKYWPAERWAAVARAVLQAQPEAQVLLCGAPAEAGVLAEICELAASGPVHNLAAELPVRRLLPLIARATGMISVDTGPAHAAAALDCPLVVMFGEQDQRVWRPRSRQAEVIVVGGAAGANSKLQDIGVDEVVAAWSRLLQRGPGGTSNT